MKIFQKAKQLVTPFTLHLKNSPIVVMDTFCEKGNESKFKVFTDQLTGGDSKGVVVFKEEDEAVTFLGQIQIDKKKQLESLPHVGIEYKYSKSVNIAKFTKILFKMRTDGQIYKIRIGVNSSYDFGQHQAYAYIVDQSQMWNTYVIPLKNFEHQGFDKEVQSLELSAEGLQLYQFDIMKESKINEKIAIQIKEFAISQEELTEQEINFKRPIFYKYLQKQDILDTGREKYNQIPQNNNQKSNQNGKSINNWFD
ncbi:unnamed protein product [Paramecium pentaurelia]|uniref:NADH:ubiquinone oxidoreductase intermediate-associated protein 30 domain-containing protein n=1 Tax=Paramecium pentaurelia TaxID=43138 RepID=A0A8S1W472_9CILI|nr:unnamed protein product [Paramecium pentaurelia]